MVAQIRSTEASRPRSKLVHHSELPRRETGGRRVEETFWHQAASGHVNPIKKRRRATLKREAAKFGRMGKTPQRCIHLGPCEVDANVNTKVPA